MTSMIEEIDEKQQRKHYRTGGEIERDILRLLLDGPKSRTYIMYHAMLSYEQLKNYLERMGYDELLKLETDVRGKVYFITTKGRKYYELLAKAYQVRQEEG